MGDKEKETGGSWTGRGGKDIFSQREAAQPRITLESLKELTGFKSRFYDGCCFTSIYFPKGC